MSSARKKFSSFSSDGWSEEGCHVVRSKSSSGQTECSCNHMTHFAVLLDYGDDLKVILLEIPGRFSIVRDHCKISLLALTLYFFFLPPICETGTKHRREGTEDSHIRGFSSFHHRNNSHHYSLSSAHVSKLNL